MPCRRVVLTGFMGAGKTTVGRLLAPLPAPPPGWKFFDTDASLVAELGAGIADLFATLGELQFREHEARLIAHLLHTDAAVIALGGGAIEHEGTRALLRADPGTCLVYLQTSLAVSLRRCAEEGGAAVRPVLRDPQLLEQRFQRRIPWYEEADFIVRTEGQTPASIARKITSWITGEVDGAQTA